MNEYFYDLGDRELLALINQVTGAAEGDKVAKLTLSTLKILKTYADFDAQQGEVQSGTASQTTTTASEDKKETTTKTTLSDSNALGLNLSYTINLNLPATADQAVFNAIFRSLRENLLKSDE